MAQSTPSAYMQCICNLYRLCLPHGLNAFLFSLYLCFNLIRSSLEFLTSHPNFECYFLYQNFLYDLFCRKFSEKHFIFSIKKVIVNLIYLANTISPLLLHYFFRFKRCIQKNQLNLKNVYIIFL